MAKKKASGGTATKTRTWKKAPKKKAATKKPTPKVGGTKGDYAPEQKPLGGMEDVDERVPELEELCQTVIANREKRASLKTDIDETLEQIEDALNEHGLDLYICNGRKFYIEPGSPSVKVVKVKQQG